MLKHYTALLIGIVGCVSLFAQQSAGYHRRHAYTPLNAHSSFSGFGCTQRDWILYGQQSNSVFGGSAMRVYYGIGAEYYLGYHWSIRGGMFLSGDNFHFTPAPITVGFLKLMANSDNSGGYRFHGRGPGRAMFYLFTSLLMNDGIGYSMHFGTHVQLMPYLGTWQLEFTNDPVTHTTKETDLCSAGLCLKIEPVRNVMLMVETERTRTSMLRDSQSGYRINFSLGYKIGPPPMRAKKF